MRKPIQIGEKKFKTKKEALQYYKEILNSYSFGDILKTNDFHDIVNLLEFGGFYDISDIEEDENIIDCFGITSIQIAKVQYNTKCFQVVYDNEETDILSYRLLINQPSISDFDYFVQAARNAIKDDIYSVKQKYFDDNSNKGYVKCQETGISSKWTELVVDHRQPNTFSVILDRYIELNTVDFGKIEYCVDNENFLQFSDEELRCSFREYHKIKATLRIVRKELNLSRTNLARVKIQKKDLQIK